jgi:hypothetical protein
MDSAAFFVGGSANVNKVVQSVSEVKKCPLADSIKHVGD